MQLRPYQQECLNSIPDSGRFVVQMATGLGKCFAPDTEILMYEGDIKKVQDIAVGDRVMGWDNQPRTVVSLANGTEAMYRIIQAKKGSYVVNGSHILSLKITGISNERKKYVYDCNGNKYTTGDIVNISVYDYLKCSNTFKHVAKGYSVGIEEFFIPTYLDVDPYFLGLWLGDGNSRSMSITTADPEIFNYLSTFAKQHGYTLKKEPYSNSGKADTYRLISYKHYSYMRQFLREELYLNKHIPREVKTGTREQRLQLIAGLLDSDGHLNTQDKHTFEYCSQHKSMVEDVAFIVRSLGMSARIFARYNKQYDKEYYYCSIWGNTEEIPTKISRKKAKAISSFKDNLNNRIEVQYEGEGQYYGFELQGNDRRFLLADFTVVHNTVVFSQLPRRGRMLILSHRDELVRQPVKYFDCPVGIEKAEEHSHGEPVVSASVQSFTRRVTDFKPEEFDTIVVDECHHAAARTYRNITDYFTPRLLLGFTATPNRNDGLGLDKVFDSIVFERDLEWGIRNGWLCPIKAMRVTLDIDLSRVATRLGDYSPESLDKAVNIESANKAIADTYKNYAKGQTVIFCTSVDHAKKVAALIPDAEYVVGNEDRSGAMERFRQGKTKCLTNCMVLTEGTDLPMIETIMIARPTQNESLYCQMVGRGTRLYEGKEFLTLIDLVDGTDNLQCTAPTLVGADPTVLEPYERQLLDGDLFDLPGIINDRLDQSHYWIKNVQMVELWAKRKKYNLHHVNYFRTATGELILSNPRLRIPAPDKLGQIMWMGKRQPYQKVLDDVYVALRDNCGDRIQLWSAQCVKNWGYERATDKQMDLIKKIMPRREGGTPWGRLTKSEAAQVITRLTLKGGL